MNPGLPNAVVTYVDAMNRHDADAVARCFSPDALVHDEGRDHRGAEEIRAWSAEVIAKYSLSIKVLHFRKSNGGIMVETEVTGTFDGSPAKITNVFHVASDGLITSLDHP